MGWLQSRRERSSLTVAQPGAPLVGVWVEDNTLSMDQVPVLLRPQPVGQPLIPNRLQPEVGILADTIRHRNQTSDYAFDIEEYFTSGQVLIDGGVLRGLIRQAIPGTHLYVNGGGYDELSPGPSAPSRYIELSHHEGGILVNHQVLTCNCCGHQDRDPVIIPYVVDPRVRFIRSGYTIYPIGGGPVEAPAHLPELEVDPPTPPPVPIWYESMNLWM